MARGEPAAPIERLEPYLKGAQFALVALRRSHSQHSEVVADIDRYLALVKRYLEAVAATRALLAARTDPADT